MEGLSEEELTSLNAMNADQKVVFWQTRSTQLQSAQANQLAAADELRQQLAAKEATLTAARNLEKSYTESQKQLRDAQAKLQQPEQAALRLQQESFKLTKNTTIQKQLQLYAKAIAVCDGSNRQNLRKFLESLNNAQEWSGASSEQMLQLCSRLISGNLQNALTRHVHTTMNGLCSWEQAKDFIKINFLGKDELSHLRSQLVRLSQGTQESCQNYIRRWDSLVSKCYDEPTRGLDIIQEQLVKSFVQGLGHSDVRTQVWLSDPKRESDAYELAADAARAYELAKNTQGIDSEFLPPLRQGEEEMDVDALTQKSDKKGTPTPDGFSRRINKLYDLVADLKGQLARLQAAQRRPGPSQYQRAPVPADSQVKTCYYCNTAGHIKRDCPARHVPMTSTHTVPPRGGTTFQQRQQHQPQQQPQGASMLTTEDDLIERIGAIEARIFELQTGAPPTHDDVEFDETPDVAQ
jgi:hypothetical protein